MELWSPIKAYGLLCNLPQTGFVAPNVRKVEDLSPYISRDNDGMLSVTMRTLLAGYECVGIVPQHVLSTT